MISCITKDDVKSGRWAVKLELVLSANAKRKMDQNLPAIVSYTERTAAEDPTLVACHANGRVIFNNREDFVLGNSTNFNYLELRRVLLSDIFQRPCLSLVEAARC
jgi:hypothetical protein